MGDVNALGLFWSGSWVSLKSLSPNDDMVIFINGFLEYEESMGRCESVEIESDTFWHITRAGRHAWEVFQ